MICRISDTIGHEALTALDGQRLATALLGDAIAANMFMVGVAWQKGLLPLSLEAIERAIRKSDPLPLPDQPGLFKRELKLKYRPFDE